MAALATFGSRLVVTPLRVRTKAPRPVKAARLICWAVATNIEERVKTVIVEQLGVSESEIKPWCHITDDLGADSIDVVELMLGLKDEFGVDIPDEEAENLCTVRDIVEYIDCKHSQAGLS